MEKIWTEKYRPSDFDEIKGQPQIVSRIRAFVEKQNMPHLLFAGPPGVGKSSLAIVIAKQLFGEEWRNNFLELNSSDERGIDIVRNKVKDFARTRAIGDVPFKIILLDESDALTKDAQNALRRTMENYTSTCRFVLSCNYSSKIIDPIQSRCTIFKFKPLPKEDIFNLITTIAKNENLELDEAAKDALFVASGGDCRKMENILQSCACISNKIEESHIYEIASAAKPAEVKEVLEKSISGNFLEARKLLLKTMLHYGLSGLDVIKQIQSNVWNLDVDDKKKMDMIEACGDIEFRIVEGSDDFVQLEALLARFGKQ
jgi:replication factor C small subunit